MPPQHVEIAETIAALKRTLRREREAPTEQPIYSATNRGHKLKRGAGFVRAGALPYPHGPEGYKQRIEHAGYTRYILSRNPKRYNEYGDELEESESDADADADAEDENPYSGVRIEELLCPLKHPSELATHPTLSLPFIDRALPDMVRTTEDKLREERANLWRAKNLSRQFMGDEPWMPLGSLEANDEWDLFEPKPVDLLPASKKRKRNSDQNGVNGHGYANADTSDTAPLLVVEGSKSNPTADNNSPNKKDKGHAESTLDEPTEQSEEATGSFAPTTNGVHNREVQPETKDEAADEMADETAVEKSKDIEPQQEAKDAEQQDDDAHSEDETNPQPTRRITRALAAEHNSQTAPTPPPQSPNSTTSTVDSSLLQADPLFLLPLALAANHRAPRSLARLGLPVDELMETRRLLMMYIQKQEESVRGYEALLGKLVKAKRMRDKVWEWCKTEGHVGEWSDGEDWIDAEAWGLAPEELKKGKDEEEVEGQEDTGRKGKRRRRD